MAEDVIPIPEPEPCPFCGGDGEIGWIESRNRPGGLYIVKCAECGASGSPVRTLYNAVTNPDDDFVDAEALEAVVLWNTRYNDETGGNSG